MAVMDKEFYLKILRNAEELLDEAEILYQHRKLKRSAFLIITSHEEIEKAKALLENPSTLEIFKHDYKFKTLNEGFGKLADQFLNEEFRGQIFDIIADSIQKANPELPAEILETKVNEAITKAFGIAEKSIRGISFTHIRGSCLYIDKNQRMKYETAEEMNSLNQLYNLWVPRLRESIKDLRSKIQQADTVS